MTEAERISKEGWLPASFWQEQTLCGHKVTEHMKKVWAIELDLYRAFEKVCVKHGLEFFTDGGTTLGAVRHGGFIPWDDDFDVCLPRDSYEKLKTLAGEFAAPYFLQNAHTDPEFGYSFMRLRNENTAVVVEPFQYCKFCQGIYIDVFPIDKVREDDYIERREKIAALIKKNSAYMRRDCLDQSERDRLLVEQYCDLSMPPAAVFDEIEKIATQDEGTATDHLSLLVSTQYDASKKIWPKRVFDSYVEKDFEGVKVRIPAGYDEQLKIYFGNYMEYPPVEARGDWHHIQFYPDIPYRDFYRETYHFTWD